MYLAGLDDPSLPDDPDAAVAFQAYPAYDMLDAGFTTYNQVLFEFVSRYIGGGIFLGQKIYRECAEDFDMQFFCSKSDGALGQGFKRLAWGVRHRT